MIRQKQLVAGLAEILDVPLATMICHDRNLQNAGIRKKALRGRGENVASAHDAAVLIVAALASPRTKDSAATVQTNSYYVEEIAQSIFVRPNYRPWQQITLHIKKSEFVEIYANINRETLNAVAELMHGRR